MPLAKFALNGIESNTRLSRQFLDTQQITARFTNSRILTKLAAGEIWRNSHMSRSNRGWPRNNSTGPHGGFSTGPGGGLSTGPGGGASTGPRGGLSTGPDGGLSTGPGGGLSTGPGGGLSTGPGGGLSTGPGGGLSTGPYGGLSSGPGGGLSAGPTPYYSNIPPRQFYLRHLKERGYDWAHEILRKAWGIE
jgi:hypothetical protein